MKQTFHISCSSKNSYNQLPTRPTARWNAPKMDPEIYAEKRIDAETMFNYSCDLAVLQDSNGLGFILEHPAPASSWSLPKARGLLTRPGVIETNFDQCAVGLVSPGDEPMKKRTKLVSNIAGVSQLFGPMQCACVVPHRQIQGSQNGFRLSTYAQSYPRQMCDLMVQAAQ